MPSFDRNTTGKEVVETFAATLEGKTGKVRESQKPGDTLIYITVVITGPSEKSIGAEVIGAQILPVIAELTGTHVMHRLNGFPSPFARVGPRCFC